MRGQGNSWQTNTKLDINRTAVKPLRDYKDSPSLPFSPHTGIDPRDNPTTP